jgi:SAM-dependent methyltransferase
MIADAMEVHGAALWAFFVDGDTDAEEIVRTDAGRATPVPVRHFFSRPPGFLALENAALARSIGRVLDVGAGSGLHALALQHRGLAVTAVDICPQAVDIMRRRGVRDVHCADILTYQGGPFNTLLMLGHGLGITETLPGLDRFLADARFLVSSNGQILAGSLDVRVTRDPENLAYQEANQRAGRYIGEIRIQLEYAGRTGPYFGWLHVDPETLAYHAAAHGWNCEVIAADDAGNYVARLIR